MPHLALGLLPARAGRRLILACALLLGVAHGAASRKVSAQSGTPSPTSSSARDAGNGVVTPARLSRPAAGEWLQNGRDYGNRRFAPLAQITTKNVSRLTPRWRFQLDMPQPGAGAEATPLVADGRLYASTDYDVVTAFDLRTRRRLWRYAPTLGIAKLCCGRCASARAAGSA